MRHWQDFASGYRNIADSFGPWRWAWMSTWILAGMPLGFGFVAHNLGAFLIGVLALVILVIRCLDCADMVVRPTSDSTEFEADYDPLAKVRTPYDPPTRVLGPNHDGVDL